jgi:hypothetical protein
MNLKTKKYSEHFRVRVEKIIELPKNWFCKENIKTKVCYDMYLKYHRKKAVASKGSAGEDGASQVSRSQTKHSVVFFKGGGQQLHIYI